MNVVNFMHNLFAKLLITFAKNSIIYVKEIDNQLAMQSYCEN